MARRREKQERQAKAAARPAARQLDQNGRPLGPRALETRRRLLDATDALLAERPVRDVSVVEIARRAGTSPATFYQYFQDVEEATVELAQEAAEEVPSILEPLRMDWRGKRGLDTARTLADAFVRHWDDHHAVLLFRNVAAEQGDRRFRKARIKALHPVILELAKKIGEARDAGRIPEAIHPYAAAAALASMLERLAAYHQELEYFGATRDQLVETCARILHNTVTGRPAA
jgi:AcrR family transcriptional regulator